MKRNAVKAFYSAFVSDLKVTDPGKWYQMAKHGQRRRESWVIIWAEQFRISLGNCSTFCRHLKWIFAGRHLTAPVLPLRPTTTPSRGGGCLQLPVCSEENQVNASYLYTRHSTARICSMVIMLSLPLITNTDYSLKQTVYPATWKQERVTPVPKNILILGR